MPGESIFDSTYVSETVDFGESARAPGFNTSQDVDWSGQLNTIWGGFERAVGGIPIGTIILIVKLLLALTIAAAAVIAVYFYMQRSEQRQKREEWLKKYVHGPSTPGGAAKTRWGYVKNLFASQNEADWRLAIIEADSMLEDLMMRLGYDGNTLGERLKSADQINFPKLQLAWQAHLIRNKIAHEGSAFKLSKLQAGRVMHWYEEVFKDAKYLM